MVGDALFLIEVNLNNNDCLDLSLHSSLFFFFLPAHRRYDLLGFTTKVDDISIYFSGH